MVPVLFIKKEGVLSLRFPIVASLGLDVNILANTVRAADLEILLSKATVMYGGAEASSDPPLTADRNACDTHTYLVLPGQRLESADTAESLLKELFAPRNGVNYKDRDWVSRARRVVGNPE